MGLDTGTKRSVSVSLRSKDDLEYALRLLKRKLKRDGFYVEMRKREFLCRVKEKRVLSKTLRNQKSKEKKKKKYRWRRANLIQRVFYSI